MNYKEKISPNFSKKRFSMKGKNIVDNDAVGNIVVCKDVDSEYSRTLVCILNEIQGKPELTLCRNRGRK